MGVDTVQIQTRTQAGRGRWRAWGRGGPCRRRAWHVAAVGGRLAVLSSCRSCRLCRAQTGAAQGFVSCALMGHVRALLRTSALVAVAVAARRHSFICCPRRPPSHRENLTSYKSQANSSPKLCSRHTRFWVCRHWHAVLQAPGRLPPTAPLRERLQLLLLRLHLRPLLLLLLIAFSPRPSALGC